MRAAGFRLTDARDATCSDGSTALSAALGLAAEGPWEYCGSATWRALLLEGAGDARIHAHGHMDMDMDMACAE